MSNAFFLALVGLLSISGCRGQQQIPVTSDFASPSCPQEMCVFVFDRLEEQWVYLRNLEDALRRTVSLLTSISNNEQLSEANVGAFKADPIILALLNSEPTSSRPPRSSGWEVDPVIPLSESKDWIESTNINNHERKKRGVDSTDELNSYLNEPAITSRERVAEALKWAKRGSSSRKVLFDSLMNDDPKVAAVLQNRKSPPAATNASVSVASALVMPGNASVSVASALVSAVENNVTSMNTGSALLSASLSSDNQIDLAISSEYYVNEKLSSLQDAIQCALAQLNKENVSESMGIITNPHATLNSNNYLTVQFELKTCRKYLTSVWYRISAKRDIINRQNSGITDNSSLQTFLQVPIHCLMETSNNTYSITLPAAEQEAGGCSFPLMVLEECKTYSVDIIPIYLALQGQSATVDVTTQPMNAGSTNMKSVEIDSSQNSTHYLNVQWSIESEDCAQLLTSVDVRIYQDSSNSMFSTYTIPVECFTNFNNNLFSAALSSFGNGGVEKCRSNYAWRPLDICRDYFVEIQPEYSSSQLKGRPLSKEMFTSGKDSSKCCYMLTQPTGQFQSVNHDDNFECSWLISVEENHNIWLTFTEFELESYYYHLKVYDGPYSTSRLILDHYGYQAPPSLKSSTNKLFVKLVSQNDYRQGYGKRFKAQYAAVEDSKSPHIPGCGGYIIGSGDISKPANPLSDYNSTECLWYLQSSDPMSTIVISNSNSDRMLASFPMIIYDGWTSGGRVIYNQTSGSLKTVVYSLSSRAMIRFPSWNMENREQAYSWNVISLNSQQCSYNYSMSNSGNIKSPNYPYTYNGLTDCRWTISVNSSSKIQLTFAFFETKQNYDFVTIYDGESIFSPVLNELSGQIDNPVFSITSSSNFMTVRFATYVKNQGNNNYNYYYQPPSVAGFLAIYAAIRCDAPEIGNVITPVPPHTTTMPPDWETVLKNQVFSYENDQEIENDQ